LRIVDLQIEDVAFGGKGVGREDGKAVFVPLTIDGEVVSARVTREKKQFAEAEVVELQKRSPHRTDPSCPYFGRCGGCAYQHVDYQHQLEIKSRQVRDILQRIGKLKNVPLRPIVPSPLEYAYRNRITVHARDVPDGHYTLRAKAGLRIFSQTNDAVANALRELVVDLVPANEDLLVDAFCGAGFFAKALLNKFQRVIGIDWDRFSVAAALENASTKEHYIAGDVETGLRTAFENCDADRTVLIVDPPSTGLSIRVRERITDLGPAKLIYVSCDPSTFARDLANLRSRFEIQSVTPFDMFPQTAEIEVVAELRRHN